MLSDQTTRQELLTKVGTTWIQHSKKRKKQSKKKRTLLPRTADFLRLLQLKSLAYTGIDIEFISYFCRTKKLEINEDWWKFVTMW